jgi:hypothetical protein
MSPSGALPAYKRPLRPLPLLTPLSTPFSPHSSPPRTQQRGAEVLPFSAAHRRKDLLSVVTARVTRKRHSPPTSPLSLYFSIATPGHCRPNPRLAVAQVRPSPPPSPFARTSLRRKGRRRSCCGEGGAAEPPLDAPWTAPTRRHSAQTSPSSASRR